MRSGREVAIFVMRRGRAEILLVERTPVLGGYWHTIAGAVEDDESSADAAARELFEETGLTAQPTAIGLSFAYPIADEPPNRQAEYPTGLTHVDVECFVIETDDDWEPVLNEEHVGHRWEPAATAPEGLHYEDIAGALRRLLGSAS